MDEFSSKKNVLLKNKCHILRMPSNALKTKMMLSYYQLLDYYSRINYLTDKEYHDLCIDEGFNGKYDVSVINALIEKLEELDANAEYLNGKYLDIIKTYQDEGFCSYEYSDPTKVNKKVLYNAFSHFLIFLGEDVVNIYNKMVLGHNICRVGSSDCFGAAMDSTLIDNPSIIIQNVQDYLSYYITLAHEVGHCYQFYLQRNQTNFSPFDPYAEVTSLLFEKLFVSFLIKNHIIKDDYSFHLEDNIYFLNDVSASKVLCELFMNQDVCVVNPFNLDYESSVSNDELRAKMENYCGYIMGNKKEMELTEFHYSIGNIMAVYFFERLKKDFKNEWVKYKDFLCTVNYLSMQEVFEKYFDIPLIQKEIKTFVKSYRER